MPPNGCICVDIAAFTRLFVEEGSLLSRARSYNANGCYVILSFCKNWSAHQNREENVNKNVSLKPFPSPAMALLFWSGLDHAQKCVFWNQYKNVYALASSILSL